MSDVEQNKVLLDDDAWLKLFKDLVNEDEESGENSAKIKISDLENCIRNKSDSELEGEYGITRAKLKKALKDLKKHADLNNDGLIDYEEWLQSYHKHSKDSRKLLPAFQVLLYEPNYSCRPPAVFILILSVIQAGFYIWHHYHISSLMEDDDDAIPPAKCSYLIFDPARREEVWRFLTYQFVHADIVHVAFNILMQLIVGVPLELSQPGWLGKLRLICLYMSGVLLGSVAGPLSHPNSLLAGASAGVYSLIAAHLATLVINWKEDGAVFRLRTKNSKPVPMSLNPLIRACRLALIVIFTTFDISFALYNFYKPDGYNSTSYSGHLAGATAGLLLGLTLLKNRRVEWWEKKLKKVSTAIYFILLLTGVLWHIIGSYTDYFSSKKNDFCSYSGHQNQNHI